LKYRSQTSRATRLSLLVLLPSFLSVALTTNSFASSSNSPGGNSISQASLFLPISESTSSIALLSGTEKTISSFGPNSESVASSSLSPRSETTGLVSFEPNCKSDASVYGGTQFLLAWNQATAGKPDAEFISQAKTDDTAVAPAQIQNGIILSNPSPAQGEPVKITLTEGSDSSADSVTFNGETVKLFAEEVDGKQVKTALIAISPLLKPGQYKLVAGSSEAVITVHDAHFGLQRLTLPKDKDNFNASPGEKETIAKAKSTVSDEKRWQGLFEKPVKTGRLSTRFGVRRVVNGKLLKDYFHSGLDFAAPIGTPVHAAAPGRVLVAHTGWKLHGNVVAIDHGQGVISIGIHMTKVNVKVGDLVEAGQVVGTVGRTGRASGPHLHYGVYVNNVASNPDFWFRKRY
jgi:murein DD-endopeptidase MepM/ murein hydrolase activator NlpD